MGPGPAILPTMLSPAETERELVAGAVVLATTRDLVITSGHDASSFLNGQLSQAIDDMEQGSSRRSLLLDPKGKVVAWLRVTKVEDQVFWLDMEAGFGESALARLQRFVLRTKVEFELFVANCFAVRGATLPARPASTPTQRTVEIGWAGANGFDIIGPACDLPVNLRALLGDPSLLEALRISEGVPAMGREFLPNTIPAETGVVRVSASFTKGCYTGQELVARVQSRGNNTPRKLHRFTVSGDFSWDSTASLQRLVGADVQCGREVGGTVTSIATLQGETIGLASIKRSAEWNQAASIRLPDGLVPVKISEFREL